MHPPSRDSWHTYTGKRRQTQAQAQAQMYRPVDGTTDGVKERDRWEHGKKMGRFFEEEMEKEGLEDKQDGEAEGGKGRERGKEGCQSP